MDDTDPNDVVGGMTRSVRAPCIAAALVFSAPFAHASAQVPRTDAAPVFRVQRWTQADGIPANSVTSVVQTADGYLWIGTQAGLTRFDGLRFDAQELTGLPGIGSEDVSRLVRDRAGDLWVGARSGVAQFREGRPVRIPVEDIAGVRDVAADPDGGVWLTVDDALVYVNGKEVRRIAVDRSRLGFIRSTLPLGNGRVLIGTEGRGVWLTDSIGTTRVPELAELETADVRVLVRAPDGAIWIATRPGLYRWMPGARPRGFGTTEGLPEAWVETINFDDIGKPWIGTSGAGLLYYNGTRFRPVAMDGAADIRSVFTDREGTIWIATNDQGLAALRVPLISGVTPATGLSAPVVLPIIEARDGTVWAGTFGGGVNRIRGHEIMTIGRSQGLRSDHILSLAEGQDGAIWVGTRDGLDRISAAGRIEQITLPQIGGAPILALLAGAKGVVWAGTTKGLLRIDRDSMTLFNHDNGLMNDYVFVLMEDATGELWVGTNGGGLFMLGGGTFSSYTTSNGLSTNIVTALTRDRAGRLLVGTSSGLSVMTGAAFHTLRDGPGWWKGGINRVLEDGSGDLWISSNRGVSWLAAADLEGALKTRAMTVPVSVFTEEDGMPSSETNGGIHPAGWELRDGRLLFPTMAGIAVIDPSSHGEVLSTPQPIVQGVSSANVPLHPDSLRSIAPGTRDIAFQFTAPSSVRSAEIEFRYQLVGYDTTWIHAGTRRTAYYTNLSPRQYEFRLQARRPAVAWGATKTITLRILPRYFETAWFITLCILTGALGLLLLHQLRVRSLRKHQAQLIAVVADRERAEQHYRALFEDAADVVLTIDSDARITALNRKGRELFQPRVETQSLDLRQVLHADDSARLQALIAGTDILSGAQQAITVALTDPRGTKRVLEFNIRPIEQDGVVKRFHAIGRDLTDRLRLEEQLRQAQKMEAVGRLSGGIAHDFNNMLTVIRGSAMLALDGLTPAHAVAEDLREVVRTSDRAAGLTRQLLAFSRNQIVQPTVVRVETAVTDLSRMINRLLREDVSVVNRFHAAEARVRIDRGQLEQVLVNLVINAQDAMPAGGEITIEITEQLVDKPLPVESGTLAPGRYVAIAVIDTGTGMDAETRHRIFDPFFTTKGPGKGTGLGLSNAFGIVQEAGGQLQVTSQITEGTTVRIYLPGVDEDEGADATKQDETPPPASQDDLATASCTTVLLIEDEATVRALTVRLLKRAGYTVLHAANGRDALEIAAAHPTRIDLVISDVVMPDMGGREVVELLRQARNDFKVMYMSGYNEDEILRRGIRSSADGFLEKPFTRDALLEMVTRILRGAPAVG